MTDAEKKQTVRLGGIQRFSLHDGPGIRTTVFMKGCSLRCPWCANPECISPDIQPFADEEGEEQGEFGYDITLGALLDELLEDEKYFREGGGVTFSGGEPLLQIFRYEPLLRDLKKRRIHLAVETALFVSEGAAELAKQYFDWFYIDMKILEKEECKNILGGDAEQYIINLRNICSQDREVCFRIPCSSYTLGKTNTVLIAEELRQNGIHDVEVFNLHKLAEGKYNKLKMCCFTPEDCDYASMMQEVLLRSGLSGQVVKTEIV